jgi:hypothetical protein
MAAWTPPRTWTPGEFVTALMMNTHVRDNLIHVYDRLEALHPVASGNIVIGATKRFYLDGGSNTYIHESAADVVSVVVADSTKFRVTGTYTYVLGGDLLLDATKKLYLDGGGNTYVWEEAADTFSIVTGGTRRVQVANAVTTIEAAATLFTVVPEANFAAATAMKLTHASGMLWMDGVTAPEIYWRQANARISANGSIIFVIDRDANSTSEGFYWRKDNLTDVMVLSESGYLGIGPTPLYPLHVSYSYNDHIAQFANTHASAPFGIRIHYTGASPNTVGNPFIYCQDSTTVRMHVTSSGGIYNYSAFNVNLSDVNAKERLTAAPSNRGKIAAIKMYQGRYKGTTRSNLDVMWLAQDIQKIDPDWVDVFDTRRGLLGTRDHVIFMATVGVVAEHEQDLQSLFKVVEPMKKYATRLTSLEKRVKKLEGKAA